MGGVTTEKNGTGSRSGNFYAQRDVLDMVNGA